MSTATHDAFYCVRWEDYVGSGDDGARCVYTGTTVIEIRHGSPYHVVYVTWLVYFWTRLEKRHRA